MFNPFIDGSSYFFLAANFPCTNTQTKFKELSSQVIA